MSHLQEYFAEIPAGIKPLFENDGKPWTPLARLAKYIKENLVPAMHGIKVGEVYLDRDIQVGSGTIIEHGAMIKGPAIIGSNCEIRSGAYIRGNVFIGDNCVIGHCTEIKSSIVMDGSNCGHFNYVGDSILGQRVNLGAGSVLANLRFDRKTIMVGDEETGLLKLGAVLGDDCQIGCNTVLNPGTLFERGVMWSGSPLKSGKYTRELIKELRQ